MAAGKIVYQVWRHHGQESGVSLVDTYQEAYMARKSAASYNAMEEHDTRPDEPPCNFYFVKAVSEDMIREEEEWRRRRMDSEERKCLMRKYQKVLRPLVEDMAASMAVNLEICEKERHDALRKHGGWLEGYRGHTEDLGDITCAALFSGRGWVSIEVTLEEPNESKRVENFQFESLLKSWLLNNCEAADSFENCIIDILCDLGHLRKVRDEHELKEE